MKKFNWGKCDPVYIELFTQENLINRIYEQYYHVKENDVVLDIGANYGSFTYSILSNNPKNVYCVEPSSFICEILKNNVGQNNNVTIINKAISDNNSDCIDIPDKGVYIYDNEEKKYSTITFKNLIKQNNITKVDFLKFDCEGGEYSIFNFDNQEYIKNNIKNFAGEWHISNHENSIEKFKIFRDCYLQGCKYVHLHERCGKEETHNIYNDKYLYDFQKCWEHTYLGQWNVFFGYY
jgi:FkbM family methyltransferase